MSLYRYKFLTKEGEAKKEKKFFESKEVLQGLMDSQDALLMSCRRHITLSLHASLQERALFCGHLAQFLQAGIPLLEALKAYGYRHQVLVQALCGALSSGMLFSEALQQCTPLSDPLMIHVARLGEVSGSLAAQLKSLEDHYLWLQSVRKDIWRGLSYPLLALVLLLWIIVMFLPAFLAQLKAFIQSLSGEVSPSAPFLWQLLEDLGTIGWVHLMWVFLWLGFLWVVCQWHFMRLYMDRLLLCVPLTRHLFLGRLFRSVLLQVQSGVSLFEALSFCQKYEPNLWGREVISRMVVRMGEGAAFSEVFQVSGFSDALVFQLLRAAEKTGNIQFALESIEKIKKEKLKELIEIAPLLFKSLFIITIGILLMVLIWAVFEPLYGVLENLDV